MSMMSKHNGISLDDLDIAPATSSPSLQASAPPGEIKSRRANLSSLSSFSFDAICDILSPDELLPVCHTAGTLTSSILERYISTAVQRNNVIRQELEHTAGHRHEHIGIATEQVADACREYVSRYHKRMELLQRYSAETSSAGGLLDEARTKLWSERIKDSYKRPFSTKAGRFLFAFHSLIALGSLISMTLQTLPLLNPRIQPQHSDTWYAVEQIISVFFLLDVVALLLANMFDPTKRLRENVKSYVMDISNICDVIATTLPSIQVVSGDNSFTNAFILFRLFRFVRLMTALQHFSVFEDLFETLKRSAMPLVGPVVGVVLFVVGFASLVYTMESGAWSEDTKSFLVRDEDCEMKPPFVLGLMNCPRKLSMFLSVLHSMWFSLVAVLTIGYGDLVPQTMAGRWVSLIGIVIGQLLMAMPIAIIGNQFTTVVAWLKEERGAVQKYMTDRTHRMLIQSGADKAIHEQLNERRGHPSAVVTTLGGEGSQSEPREVDATSEYYNSNFAFHAASAREKKLSRDSDRHAHHLRNAMTVSSVTQTMLPNGSRRAKRLATLPSIQLFRFLQFALKQRTLSFGQLNRMTVYIVEIFLRNAAEKYLHHVESMFQGTDEPCNAESGNPERPADSATVAVPSPTAPTLSLIHPTVRHSAPLPFEYSTTVGASPQCDVMLRSPLVQALLHQHYGPHRHKKQSRISKDGQSTALWPAQTSAGPNSSDRTTATNALLKRAYAISPTHCLIHMCASQTGFPENDSVFVQPCQGNSLVIDGKPSKELDEYIVADGTLIQYSAVDSSIKTLVSLGRPYDTVVQ